MKDIKIFEFRSCMTDVENSSVTLKKWGVNSRIVEDKVAEDFILPYLNNGYRIVQILGKDTGNHTVILQKD